MKRLIREVGERLREGEEEDEEKEEKKREEEGETRHLWGAMNMVEEEPKPQMASDDVVGGGQDIVRGEEWDRERERE